MSETFWINVASGNEPSMLALVRDVARTAPPGVPVFNVREKPGSPPVAKTLRYEMRGIDMWAEVEELRAVRGQHTPLALIDYGKRPPELYAVLLAPNTIPREMLVDMFSPKAKV
jgi:hypothetical protein